MMLQKNINQLLYQTLIHREPFNMGHSPNNDPLTQLSLIHGLGGGWIRPAEFVSWLTLLLLLFYYYYYYYYY